MFCKLLRWSIIGLIFCQITITRIAADSTFGYDIFFEKNYNTNTFGIKPNSSITPLQQTAIGFASRHRNYYVFNIGTTIVTATLKWGSLIRWKGDVVSKNLKPGEKAQLVDLGRHYYITGIQVRNEHDRRRAMVQVYDQRGINWNPRHIKGRASSKVDYNGAMKSLTASAVSQIPTVGKALSILINGFWPITEKDIWTEIREKVAKIIDPQMIGLKNIVFSSQIQVFKRKLSTINDEVRMNATKSSLSKHVMNLVDEMVGVEEEFIFKSVNNLNVRQLNFEILPLYSAFMSLKLLFYQYAVLNQNELGIDDEDVKQIRILSKDAVYNGVEQHLYEVLRERIEYAYDTCNPENTYNAVQTVRSYVNYMGISYLPFWKQLADDPHSKKRPYNHVLLYPSYFGRQTIPLLKLATMFPGVPPMPLTPKLVDGVRASMTEIEVHTKGVDQRQVVSGMITRFSDGTTFRLGNVNGDYSTKVNLTDTRIYKLMVDGRGAVEHLTIFTDREGTKKQSFGRTKNGRFDGQIYEMPNYHIAAIFVDNDGPNKHQAWNIAVSFLSDN